MAIYDYVIVGAGIIGLSIAKELKIRNPKSSVLVLDKENEPGLHASGRNSGVLHSGIYYPFGSIKAKVCRTGSIEMTDYCRAKRLPINRIGKILIPRNFEDLSQLNLLEARGRQNSIDVEYLNRKSLKLLEPEVKSVNGEALFIPSTSVADPTSILNSIINDCKKLEVKVIFSAIISNIDIKKKIIYILNGSTYNYGHFINSAGLHADRIAHKFDVGMKYTLIPFKGIYWKIASNSKLKINHLIYPVPNLKLPFLGVHTTTSMDGIVYLGPTAAPAFGRENYNGLNGIKVLELAKILPLYIQQIFLNKNGFRRLAWQEGSKLFKPFFLHEVQKILPNIRSNNLLPSAKVGIRAQMLNLETKELANDFIIERGVSSTHVLNAISPAWTSAFPFARLVIENYLES